MAFIFETPEYKEALDKFNHSEKIRAKLGAYRTRKVLKHEPSGTLESYGAKLFALKPLSPQIFSRSLIEERTLEFEGQSIPVYFVRDFFDKNEYDKVWRKMARGHENNVKLKEWVNRNPIPEDFVEGVFSEVREALTERKQEKPIPPDDLKEWLDAFPMTDIVFDVYEGPFWSTYLQKIPETDWGILRRLLNKALNEEAGKHYAQRAGRDFFLHNQSDYALLWEKTTLKNSEKKPIVLLHSILPDKKDKVDKALEKAVVHELFKSLEGGEYTLKKLSQLGRKAYQRSLLLDPQNDHWINLARNSATANLSLSPQQVDLLNDIQFPHFINGQAGSGKSTILHYLFTETLLFYFMGSFKKPPLYLTENKDLLMRATEDVRKILEINSHYAQSIEKEDLKKVGGFFYAFDTFLQKELLREEEKEQFMPGEKYVRFSRFKQLYTTSKLPKHLVKKYTPEMAWFVISTFIKGYTKDEYLSPEAFQKLPRDLRDTMDFEAYEKIYKDIWLPWYKKLHDEEGYWDRQDLVRYLLEDREQFDAQFTVIFADEAQDFTRIELELILQLSSYGDYKLKDLKQVPISLAGDPFQTVNPTGFDMNSLKRLFHDNLTTELKFKPEHEVVYELSNNYRCSYSIVQFANLIQFFRREFLRARNLRSPQQAHQLRNKNIKPPSFFSTGNGTGKEVLARLKHHIFLVPCEHEEEEEYHKAHPELPPTATLKSAVLAKGSEYEKVVLYGFGDAFLSEFKDDIRKKIWSKAYQALSASEQFRLDFFFNKLYVALTRAQKELILVDSDEAWNSFWLPLRDKVFGEATQEKWLHQVKEKEDVLTKGILDSLEDAGKGYQDTNLRQDFNRAKQNHDADLMYSCARQYRRLGEEAKANLAFGLSKEFNFNWKEALDFFRKLPEDKRKEEIERIERCAWMAGDWAILRSASGQYYSQAKKCIAQLMQKQELDIEAWRSTYTNIYEALFENQDPELATEEVGSPEWMRNGTFKNKFLQEVRSLSQDKIKGVRLMLDTFAQQFQEIFPLLAEYHFGTKEYEKAVEHWINAEHTDHERFKIARLKSCKDPEETFDLLYELRRYRDALKHLDAHQDLKVSEDHVFMVYLQTNQFERILAEMQPSRYPRALRSVREDIRQVVLFLDGVYEGTRNRSEQEVLPILSADFINALVEVLEHYLAPSRLSNRRAISWACENNQTGENLKRFIAYIVHLLNFPQKLPTGINDRPLKVLALALCREYAYSYETLALDYINLVAFTERVCDNFVDILPAYEDILKYMVKNKRTRGIPRMRERWQRVKYEQLVTIRGLKSEKLILKKIRESFNKVAKQIGIKDDKVPQDIHRVSYPLVVKRDAKSIITTEQLIPSEAPEESATQEPKHSESTPKKAPEESATQEPKHSESTSKKAPEESVTQEPKHSESTPKKAPEESVTGESAVVEEHYAEAPPVPSLYEEKVQKVCKLLEDQKKADEELQELTEKKTQLKAQLAVLQEKLDSVEQQLQETSKKSETYNRKVEQLNAILGD